MIKPPVRKLHNPTTYVRHKSSQRMIQCLRRANIRLGLKPNTLEATVGGRCRAGIPRSGAYLCACVGDVARGSTGLR